MGDSEEDTEHCFAGARRPLAGKWRAQALMEPVPGVRPSEDTVSHASPLSPRIRATWFPVIIPVGWMDLDHAMFLHF